MNDKYRDHENVKILISEILKSGSLWCLKKNGDF